MPVAEATRSLLVPTPSLFEIFKRVTARRAHAIPLRPRLADSPEPHERTTAIRISHSISLRPGQVDANGALNETADPKGQAFLRSSMDLPRGMNFGAALRWVDALHIDNGSTGGPVAGSFPPTGSSTRALHGRRRGM